jgi:transglutaminase superfamily protein
MRRRRCRLRAGVPTQQDQHVNRYWIANHVYPLVTESTIWLDLKADRYFGTSHEDSLTLANQVEGWPMESNYVSADATTTGTRSDIVIAALVKQGLLTTDAARGRPYAPLSPPRVSNAIGRSSGGDRPRPRQSDMFVFARAYLMATITLRTCSPAVAINAVRRRVEHRSKHEVETDLGAIQPMVEAFHALRVFTYTSKLACLFDSIVLMHYLLSRAVVPTLVIGIAEHPFRAHCWVQHKHFLLNGDVAVTQQYAPILSI